MAQQFVRDYASQANFTELYGWGASPAAVSLESFGAAGNGSTDDTSAVQSALSYASKNNGRILLAAGASYKCTSPLFAWGKCSIANADESSPGELKFSLASNYPYVVNFGISAFKSGTTNFLEAEWSGSIEGIRLTLSAATGSGRLLYFWRTRGASVIGNTFTLGAYQYSATSSGNDSGYVYNSGSNCVRRNIRILGNTINATADSGGGEGIGLNSFDGALIANNVVQGVGDDMVGLHYCRNVRVMGNHLRGTDGRIYIGNCQNVEVAGNYIARMPQNGAGTWYAGSSLISVDWEVKNNVAAGTYANDYINIHDNDVVHPSGSIDGAGGMIYVYGARHTSIKNNRITCDSSSVTGNGIYIQPADLTGSNWTDPDGRDATGLVSKVYELDVSNNTVGGAYARPVTMTGSGAKYAGPVTFRGNIAGAYSLYGQGSYLIWGNDNQWTNATTTDASGTLTIVDQAEQSGQNFANVGAVAAWHYILPSAAVGLWFTFTKVIAQTMDVTAAGSDKINNNSAGGKVTLTNIGSSCLLKCYESGKWTVVADAGAYTVT